MLSKRADVDEVAGGHAGASSRGDDGMADAVGGSAAADAIASGGALGGEVGSIQMSAVIAEERKLEQGDAGERSSVEVLRGFLEAVADLSEELDAADTDGMGALGMGPGASQGGLPLEFVQRAHREIEQEACTQLLELLEGVTKLDDSIVEMAQALLRTPPPRMPPPPRGERVVEGGGPGAGWKGGSREGAGGDVFGRATLVALDLRLEETAAMLELIHTFALWCDDQPQPPLEPLIQPMPPHMPPPALPHSEAGTCSVAAAADAAANAVSACALSLSHCEPFGTAEPQGAVPPPHAMVSVAEASAAAVIPGPGPSAIQGGLVAKGGVVESCVGAARGLNGDTASATALPACCSSDVADAAAPDAAAPILLQERSAVAPKETASAGASEATASAHEEAASPAALKSTLVAAPSASPVAPRVHCAGRCRLEAYAQSLGCSLVAGESHYMRRAVELASISEETCDASSGQRYSFLDDAFYVLLHSFRRAVRACEARAEAAAITIIPLLHPIADVIRESTLATLELRRRRSGAPAATNGPFLIVANSFDCAAAYVRELRGVIRSSFEEQFGSLAPMAEGSLDELEALSEHLESITVECISQIAATLMPTEYLMLEWGPTDFRLSDGYGGEAKETAARIAFDQQLLRPLMESLEALRPLLRPPALERLVHALAAAFASQLEQGSKMKRYDELGALLFGEQVRRLVNALSGLVATGSARNEFARVSQLAFLLNAGSVQEAAGLLMSQEGAAGGGSRLTRAEAAAILSLRVEFDQAAVRDLILDCEQERAGHGAGGS